MSSKYYYSLLFFITMSRIHGMEKHKDCNNKCISKCCPENYYIEDSKCVVGDKRLGDFSDVKVYDENFDETRKSLKDTFRVVDGHLLNLSISDFAKFDYFLVDDGNLYLQLAEPNTYPRVDVIENEHFCVGYYLLDNVTIPNFWISLSLEDEYPKNEYFVIFALLVSCFFLSMVLAIYIILKLTRKLSGKIIMALVGSLLVAFGTIVAITVYSVLGYQPEPEFCIASSFCIYFSMLASFFWMNVLSYDIWRSVRSLKTPNSRSQWHRFCIYAAYAWGVPLVMSIMLVIINEVDLTNLPWLIKPNIPTYGCFLTDHEKFLYLYIPMTIIFICNWTFFFMTAAHLWRTNQSLNQEYDCSNLIAICRRGWERFILYFKLFLVMGVTWILDVATYFNPDIHLWYITKAFHMLTGVGIFIIFICKRSILIALRERFCRRRRNP